MGDLKVSFGTTLFMCTLYVVIGITSVLCNSMNLTIALSSREIRRKYIYFVALDMGEFVNGISYILVGTGRGAGLLGGYLGTPLTVHDCFYKKYWPHSLILGTELPSFCIILISCERMCAVLKPAAYNRIFMGKYKIGLLLTVPFAGLISLLVGGLSALGTAGNMISATQHCAIISSTAIWYSTFHFIFIVLAYVISFISIFTVWRFSKKYSKGKVKSDNRLGMMLVITGTSIMLISSESIVMIFIRWGIYSFNDIEVAVTYAMPGFLSILNTIINLSFRPEFRQQLFFLLGVRYSEPNTTAIRPWTTKLKKQSS